MRGATPDIILQSSNKATNYALQRQANAAHQQQVQQERQQKERDQNMKAFMDMYKIDPGKPWERFNDKIYEDVSAMRDWVAQEQYRGTKANDPYFQQQWNAKQDNLKRESAKSVYLQDYISSENDKVAKNKYLDGRIYAEGALAATTDGRGHILHPDDVNQARLEENYRSTRGFKANLYAQDFVKASPEDLITWVQQQNSRYGGVMTTREELASQLYQTEKLPNGSYRIKTDPATGLPVMNITDDVINRWKADDWAGRWLTDQVSATGIDPYQNPQAYKEAERNIIEQYVSPFAHSQKKIASASYSEPNVDRNYLGSGMKEDDYANAMEFKKVIEEHKNGNLSYVESNPRVGGVIRKNGVDTVYGKEVIRDENGKIIDGEILAVLDPKEPGYDQKVAQLVQYTKKPTTEQLRATPPYIPEGELDLKRPDVRTHEARLGLIRNQILNGKMLNRLEGKQDKVTGQWVKKAERDGGKIKLTMYNGRTRTIPANEAHADEIDALLRGPEVGTGQPPQPAAVTQQAAPAQTATLKMPNNIN